MFPLGLSEQAWAVSCWEDSLPYSIQNLQEDSRDNSRFLEQQLDTWWAGQIEWVNIQTLSIMTFQSLRRLVHSVSGAPLPGSVYSGMSVVLI